MSTNRRHIPKASGLNAAPHISTDAPINCNNVGNIDVPNLKALSHLAALFRPTFLEKLAKGQHIKMARELFAHAGISETTIRSISLMGLLDSIAKALANHYRCEYIYKNSLINNLKCNFHDPAIATAINEFRAGDCRADVVILNGTSTVYEIKTELDTLSKLTTQTSEYKKIFDKIYIVTSDRWISAVMNETDISIGVMLLNTNMELDVVREAVSNKSNVSQSHVFDCLWRSEYLSVLGKLTGTLPSFPNGLVYRECKKLFVNFDPITCHDLFVEALKNRQTKRPLLSLVNNVPQTLTYLLLMVSCTVSQAQAIQARLWKPCDI